MLGFFGKLSYSLIPLMIFTENRRFKNCHDSINFGFIHGFNKELIELDVTFQSFTDF